MASVTDNSLSHTSSRRHISKSSSRAASHIIGHSSSSDASASRSIRGADNTPHAHTCNIIIPHHTVTHSSGHWALPHQPQAWSTVPLDDVHTDNPIHTPRSTYTTYTLVPQANCYPASPSNAPSTPSLCGSEATWYSQYSQSTLVKTEANTSSMLAPRGAPTPRINRQESIGSMLAESVVSSESRAGYAGGQRGAQPTQPKVGQRTGPAHTLATCDGGPTAHLATYPAPGGPKSSGQGKSTSLPLVSPKQRPPSATSRQSNPAAALVKRTLILFSVVAALCLAVQAHQMMAVRARLMTVNVQMVDAQQQITKLNRDQKYVKDALKKMIEDKVVLSGELKNLTANVDAGLLSDALADAKQLATEAVTMEKKAKEKLGSVMGTIQGNVKMGVEDQKGRADKAAAELESSREQIEAAKKLLPELTAKIEAAAKTHEAYSKQLSSARDAAFAAADNAAKIAKAIAAAVGDEPVASTNTHMDTHTNTNSQDAPAAPPVRDQA